MGYTYNATLEKLNVLQRQIIRIITFSPFRTSMSRLFQNLHILSLQQINKFQTGVFVYNVTKGKYPQVLSDLFIQNSSIHSHYTRRHTNLHIIRCNSKMKEFSIKHHGVEVWNDTPPPIKNYSLCMFKKHLKLYYINSQV